MVMGRQTDRNSEILIAFGGKENNLLGRLDSHTLVLNFNEMFHLINESKH
jgi:hypothetical protein